MTLHEFVKYFMLTDINFQSHIRIQYLYLSENGIGRTFKHYIKKNETLYLSILYNMFTQNFTM
jgi:hypothetical protein